MGSWFYEIGGYGGLINIVMLFGMVVLYVLFLIAAWKAMRAHQSLAGSVKEFVESMKTKKEP